MTQLETTLSLKSLLQTLLCFMSHLYSCTLCIPTLSFVPTSSLSLSASPPPLPSPPGQTPWCVAPIPFAHCLTSLLAWSPPGTTSALDACQVPPKNTSPLGGLMAPRMVTRPAQDPLRLRAALPKLNYCGPRPLSTLPLLPPNPSSPIFCSDALTSYFSQKGGTRMLHHTGCSLHLCTSPPSL